jgi:hypothetical protein
LFAPFVDDRGVTPHDRPDRHSSIRVNASRRVQRDLIVNTEILFAPATAQELALTGSNTAVLVSIAFGLLLAGLMVTRRSRAERP